MDMFNFDGVMWAAAIAGHFVLLLVLFKRGTYKEFPLFSLYVLLALLADPFMLLLIHKLRIPGNDLSASPTYFRVYYAMKVPEYLLGLGVLIEIGRNVLQPVKRSLPKGSIVIFGVLLIAGTLVTYLLVGHAGTGTLLTGVGNLFVKVGLINAILRVVSFVVLAAFAQMLGIGWKNHVVQLTTGLAFYGAVDLIVRLVQALLATGVNAGVYIDQYRSLDKVRVISYLSTLTFWCWSFYRREAPRKEFSPQMSQFLVSIAGAAKRNRSLLGR